MKTKEKMLNHIDFRNKKCKQRGTSKYIVVEDKKDGV